MNRLNWCKLTLINVFAFSVYLLINIGFYLLKKFVKQFVEEAQKTIFLAYYLISMKILYPTVQCKFKCNI